MLLGGMMAIADMLGGEAGPQLAEVLKRRGTRVFESEDECLSTLKDETHAAP